MEASTGSDLLRWRMASSMLKQTCLGTRPPYCTGMRRIVVFLLGSALLAQSPKKQADQDLPAPIKVDVDVVNVLTSVRDKRGGLIGNLEKNDFTVLEDGKPQ